jgi:hypothetical protein
MSACLAFAGRVQRTSDALGQETVRFTHPTKTETQTYNRPPAQLVIIWM